MNNKYYSVVASVFGVEKYLDDFFVSIVSQTLDFKKYIELVIIDDGSKDGSAAIIKMWQQHYPENIKYYYKQNGGLSSARNEGLKYVTTDWVSFIDPDDFIDESYFEEAHKFLIDHPDDEIGMVSCNHIFYLEKEDILSDSHPLSFRFKQEENIFELPNLQNHFQLSVNSILLRTDIINIKRLKMDERVKPTFEDAHFLGRYLLGINGYKVAFLKEAKYYYRKRKDNSSLIDSSWNKREQYTSKLKYGYLNLLEYAKVTNTEIPTYIQRTVLYDLFWYVKHLINHNEKISFLSVTQRTEFLLLIKEIFSYIDLVTIDGFSIGGCWFFHKVGMIGAFKGVKTPHQIVYVEAYDSVKNMLQLKYYYWGNLPIEYFYLNEVNIFPEHTKTRSYDFIGENFVNERIIWIPLSGDEKTLVVSIGGVNTRLSFAGKQYHQGIESKLIFSHFGKTELNDSGFPISIRLLRKQVKSPVISKPYKNVWLFMDRDIQADDNAEHLYRYVTKYHPSINAYFVLRKTSHDWPRLQKEGFRLLDFDSHSHKLALLNADHLVSSHVDHYVVSPLEKKWFSDLLTFHFTFLQHGITKDDISNWLNNKSIDLLVTATPLELKSIAEDNNRYKYSSKEVSLIGFPRHDALLKLNREIETEKLILIMPTWRQGVVGPVVGQGNERDLNDKFYASDYALSWRSFLHSDELKSQVMEYGFKVAFFPHVNIQPYLNWFETPDFIDTLSHNNIESIQHLFCKASVLITDYSSVAFEMAYINRAVIYYQFDRNYVFGDGHLTDKGYFDYEKDGFGPVCLEQNQVLGELASILDNAALPDQNYLDRMKTTFVHKDGLCCQRVFESIKNLERQDGHIVTMED